ncbi:MAG: efflux RND transporter periplasmic adaptor subunit [Chitinispirillia bacterium]|nr:efflux RND transporter periplasmic adaptor subunit [Chitinispirillia bacterium]MCL2241748.1 efflux RND transporter periplasmic adaptor subunit [Chitinispirillia bacterium]
MSNPKISKTLALLCAAAILATSGLACNRKTNDLASSAPQSAEAEKIVLPVKAAASATRDIAQTLSFSGNIDAFRRAAIAPAVMGSRVLNIQAEEGQTVKEGQLLVRMEDFQLRQSEAQLLQLEADYKRMESLYSRGSVTQQQYEQVRTSYASAKAGYELLKNSVELRAPFSGTVIGKYVNEGEVYTGSPGVDGIAGVLAVAQLGRMKIEIMVPEQDFVRLRTGQTARIRVDAFSDTVFEGKIFTVNPSLSRGSRTSRVAIEIRNDKQLLKPGMFAKVEIVTNSLKNVLAVPSSAIITRDGEPHVFTVENRPAPFTGTPALVKVKTGMITDKYAQILDGIGENVLVLTDNNAGLSDGSGIRVMSVN